MPSNEVMLAAIAGIVTVAGIAQTISTAWLAYKQAALKTSQDALKLEAEKNAAASRHRWAQTDETCREVKAETAAQTELLNELAPPEKRIKSTRPGDSGFAPPKA